MHTSAYKFYTIGPRTSACGAAYGREPMLRLKQGMALLLAVLVMTAAGAQAADLPDFTELAKNAGPAVVNISTERTSPAGPEEFFGGMMRNVPPGFDKFFEQFGQGMRRPQQHKQRSLGSGFIISADGYIVTNNHVVADADVIRVNLQGATGKADSIKAKLVGSDEETDIALLKVDVKDALPFLKFGDSDKLQVGEWLLAIGNPFGLDHTVTAGILSAKGRNIRSGPFDNFLQTDASINPGNSGGPLLNMRGEVIGINTAIIASGQGIGFAIPSTMAASVTDQIKSGKKVSRGWLGVSIQDVDENTAKALGLSKPQGALVGGVMEGEPAAKAGVQAGDIILSVDGKDIEDSAALLRAIAAKAPGSKTALVLWRDGKKENRTVELGERQSEQSAAHDAGKGGGHQTGALGIAVRPLTAEEAKLAGVEKGLGLLITGVEQGKPGAEAELNTGDIILSANLKPVKDSATLAKIVKEEGAARGAVMLQISRRGEKFFRTVLVAKK